MPYFGIFGLEVGKNYCHIWNQHPQICLVANFAKKKKSLNFGPKMCDSGIFGLEFEKKYCQIWNQHPRICLIAKYLEIMKMPKFGTKSVFLGYFLARILKKLLSYLKLAPSILSISENSRKNKKCLSLGPQMPDLSTFGLEFENNIVIFEISTLEFM